MIAPDLPAPIRKAIDQVDLVTFDIFDTALVRCVEQPVDVFLLLGHEANIAEQQAFARARIKAESQARKTAWDERQAVEVSLSEIYASLSGFPEFAPLDLQDLMQRERDLELRLCQMHPIIGLAFEYAQQQGKRTGFLSDMYLDTALIAAMLEKCGYVGYDFLHVSSDVGKTKSQGDLYQHARLHHGVDSAFHLHIGDNQHADIQQAQAAGIRTYSIVKNAEIFPSTRIARRFKRCHITRLDWGASSAGKNAGTEIWASLWRGLVAAKHGQPEDFWFDLGYSHVGMLLLGFVMWLNRRADEDQVSELYFLARDGHVIQRVQDRLRERDLVRCEGRYLYASRRALNLPAITRVDEKACDFLVSGTSRLTVVDFLLRVGLSPDGHQADIQRAGLRPDQIIDSGQEYGQLRALFRQLEPRLLELAGQERQMLNAYWQQEGLFAQSHIGLVDIGWHGSLQDSFLTLLRRFGSEALATGYYLGTFPPARARTEAGARHRGYFCQGGEPAERLAIIKASVEVFEWLFCAPHGSVLGFQKSLMGQRVEPVFESGDLESVRELSAARTQEGALQFIDDVLNCFSLGTKPPPIPIGFEVSLLHDLLKQPTAEEARLLGDLPHAEGFGGVSRVRAMGRPEVNLFNPLAWPELIRGYRQAFWRQGYLRRLRPDAW